MTKEIRTYNGEKSVSSTHGTMKTGPLHVKQWDENIPLHHIQKWLKMVYLNVRSEFTKVLGENIGGTLLDIYCSNIFLDQSPKAKGINSKINKWELNRLGKAKKAEEVEGWRYILLEWVSKPWRDLGISKSLTAMDWAWGRISRVAHLTRANEESRWLSRI